MAFLAYERGTQRKQTYTSHVSVGWASFDISMYTGEYFFVLVSYVTFNSSGRLCRYTDAN